MSYREENIIKRVFQKKIQNYFFNKFITKIKESKLIIKLNDILKDNISRFEQLNYILIKNETINEFSNILSIYYKYNKNCDIKINSKHLLSAWMIIGCPETILENIDSTEKFMVFEYAKKIIEIFNIILFYDFTKNTINNINKDINIIKINLNKIISSYSYSINLFIENDKIIKLNYFTREWINLEKTRKLILESEKYDDLNKQEVLKMMDKDRIMIEKYIKIFSKETDYEKLKKIINITHNMSKKIIANYKIKLIDDIKTNFVIFTKIFLEIKAFLLIFNKTKENEYNQKIDHEFYIQLIKNNILKYDDICKYGDYIIKEITNISSISLEEITIKKWNNLKNNDYNELNNFFLIAELLILCLETIKDIKTELNDYELLLQIV